MKVILKRGIILFLAIVVVATSIAMPIPVSASWTEYTSWGSWSGWQDSAVSETSLRDVETRQVYVNTTYHYFRYSNQYSGGYGSYVYSSSYPNYYTYDFDSELEYVGTAGGYNKYRWWYSSSNYVSVYGASPYSTDNYKTQYRYRTRDLIYYYTVSYNANGGSGAPSSQTKTGGKSLALSSTVPTKQFTLTYNANGGSVSSTSKKVSCTFKNWKASNGTTYNKGASYSSDADTTMTAQWTNPTAGTLLTPTRTGYTFKGWYTAASGGSQITSSSTIFANTTLYAQWTANAYSVKYNGNGSTSGSMSNSSHSYDSSKNLSANGFGRTGYTFSGWNTKTDGSGTSYSNGASVKNLSSTNGTTVNIYAQWVPNTYTIKYDGNGSTSGTMANSSCTYDVSSSLLQNKYERTYYLFNGWNTKADGTGVAYSNQESVKNLTATNNGTVVLYAQWTLNEYVVSFDANGGDNPPSNQSKVNGIDLELSKSIPNKKYTITYRLNYSTATSSVPKIEQSTQKVQSTFAKWNTLADGSGVDYYPGDMYKDNSTLKLYAIWSGASNVGLYTPTREGYYFVGWNGVYNKIDETIGLDKDTVNGAFSSPMNVYGDLTLTAQWTPKQYTLSFDATGGECLTASKKITFDSTYGVLPVPQKAGYTFEGWFTSIYGGEELLSDHKVEQSKNMTVYAMWSEKDVSSISVDTDKSKTVYFVGEEFDASKVALVVKYADNDTRTIDEGFECSNPDLNKVSQKRIKVTYKEHTAYYVIDVINAPLEEITIKSLPSKVDYYVGDEIILDGLEVQASYSNGYTQTITSGYTLNYDLSGSGSRIVEVVYTEGGVVAKTSFNVEVENSPRVYSNNISAESGELLSIPVYISDNTGIMGFGIEVTYNDKVMTPLSVDCGDLIEGVFDDSIATTLNNSFKIYWTGSEDMSKDGLLFTMHFSLAENAYGTYEIKIDNIKDDTFNENWETINLNCQDIVINVDVSDNGKTTIVSDNLSVKTGSKLELPIRVINNNGFEKTTVSIKYNQDAFVPLEVKGDAVRILGSNCQSASGELVVDIAGLSSLDSECVLFTLVFDTLYCSEGEYSMEIETSSGITCLDSTIKVTEGSATVFSNGNTIEDNMIVLPVSIVGNPGLMGFKLQFGYDAKVLKPISVSTGSIITNGMSDNTIATSSNNNFSVIWIGNDDISEDGELLILKFELQDEAATQTYVTVDYVPLDTYNSEWQDVGLNCKDLIVTINKKCTHSDIQVVNATTSTCVEKGYSGDVICNECGETISYGVELELVGHNYTSIETPPTEDTMGYTTHICSVCKDSYVDSYVDPIPSLTLSTYQITLFVGDSTMLNATAKPYGKNVAWVSSDENVAKVTDGSVTAKNAGVATVTVSFVHNGVTYSRNCLVTVVEPEAEIVSVEIESLPYKTTYYLGDDIDESGLKLKIYLSTGDSYVVSGGFDIEGFDSGKAGESTLTVRYEGFTATFSIRVVVPYLSMSVDKLNVFVGETDIIKVTTMPTLQNVTWNSSNKDVAYVVDGVVVGETVGTTTITAEFVYNGIRYTADCYVVVSEKPVEPCITINTDTLSMFVGDVHTIGVITIPENVSVEWSSSNESVVTVDGGIVSARGPGSADLVAGFTYNNVNYSATCSITVYEISSEVDSIIITAFPRKTHYVGDVLDTRGLILTAMLSNGESYVITGGYTVTDFDSSVAGVQKVKIAYSGCETFFNIEVLSPSIELNSNGIRIAVGESHSLSPITNPIDQAVVWSSSKEDVAIVVDGYVVAKNQGETVITAEFIYNGLVYFATCSVIVYEEEEIYLLGDANMDGKVNIKDATLIQKAIANLTTLTETGEGLADADLNTKINIKDATAIQKHIAGIETGYPIGKPKTK